MSWSHDYWPKDRHHEILNLIRESYGGEIPPWAQAADLVYRADMAHHPTRPEPMLGRRELEKQWNASERDVRKAVAAEGWRAKCVAAKIEVSTPKMDGPLGKRKRMSPPPSPRVSPPPSPPETKETTQTTENVPGGVPATVPAAAPPDPPPDGSVPNPTRERARVETVPSVPTVPSEGEEEVLRTPPPPTAGVQPALFTPPPAADSTGVRRRRKGSNLNHETAPARGTPADPPPPPSERQLVMDAREAFQAAYTARYGSPYAFVHPGHDTARLKQWVQTFELRKDITRGLDRLTAAAVAYFEAADRRQAFPRDGSPPTSRWFHEDLGKWTALGDARLRRATASSTPPEDPYAIDNEAEMRAILGDEEYERIMAGGDWKDGPNGSPA